MLEQHINWTEENSTSEQNHRGNLAWWSIVSLSNLGFGQAYGNNVVFAMQLSCLGVIINSWLSDQ